MRVVYVCADRGIPLDGSKGASVHVRQTVRALAGLGVELTVLAERPGAADLPAAVFRTPRESTAREEPDAFPGTGSGGRDRSWRARAAAALTGIGRGRVDIVYERYSLGSSLGLELARAWSVPLVLEVNAPLIDEQARFRSPVDERTARDLERRLFSRADALVCVSSWLADYVARIRGRREEVHVLPNAVDLGLFRPGGDARGETAFQVAFAGSFKPWHGVRLLIEAFAGLAAEAPAAELLLIGDGPERPALEHRAAELGLSSRVRFTGAVAQERVAELLAGAGAAVAPYADVQDFYFSPMKVVEYLAAGAPVVATTFGDLHGALRDGESALLVPPGDLRALAAALGRLASDPGLRSRLGRAGRKVAEERLSLEAAAAWTLSLLERLGDRARTDRVGHASASGGHA